MPDIAIVTCAYGQISGETVSSMERLRLESDIDYRWAMVLGDAIIAKARSRACTFFMEEIDAPYMLFVDDDMIFTPSDVLNILTELRSGKHIVGGLYACGSGKQLALATSRSALIIDGDPHEIDGIGTGFLGISKECLIGIRDRLNLPKLNQATSHDVIYPFFENGRRTVPWVQGDEVYISEDFDFCVKAIDAGYSIWLHTGVRPDHKKNHIVKAQDVFDYSRVLGQTTVGSQEELQKKLVQMGVAA